MISSTKFIIYFQTPEIRNTLEIVMSRNNELLLKYKVERSILMSKAGNII